MIHVTKRFESVMYTVNRLTMGRFSKVVLLSLLLILAGVPSSAPCLCAQPQASHVHACCAEHQQASGARCGMASTLSVNPTCCKVAPIEFTPVLPTLMPGSSLDGAIGLNAISDLAVVLPAPILLTGPGSPRLVKLKNSHVHALLCTFLV